MYLNPENTYMALYAEIVFMFIFMYNRIEYAVGTTYKSLSTQHISVVFSTI